MERKKQ